MRTQAINISAGSSGLLPGPGQADTLSSPDTRPLSAGLLTTLDLEELLALFMQEAGRHLEVGGLAFRHTGHGIATRFGSSSRHSTSYSLSLQEESLGEVTLSRTRPFAERELAVFEQLLRPLLYPLRNALRYRVALNAAYHDPLTGLDNRAAMDQSLPRETDMARRYNLALSLLFVDLDHFKRINDEYGHAAGDCVLRNTARRMRSTLRTSDRLFRYGGEEFVLLLQATDLHGAAIVAERVRRSLEQLVTDYEGERIAVTASIGAAQLGEGENHHALFAHADKALYRAKAEGRNRVVSL
ncbi:MAG TPA: GGDEF domain-containing protein [Gammaproteobacteria bacterium]|jgi:diguanylate cyclase (GGDEF)-like protein